MFRSIGLRDEAAIVGQQPRRCPESGVQKFGKDAEIAARAGCRYRSAKGRGDAGDRREDLLFCGIYARSPAWFPAQRQCRDRAAAEELLAVALPRRKFWSAGITRRAH